MEIDVSIFMSVKRWWVVGRAEIHPQTDRRHCPQSRPKDRYNELKKQEMYDNLIAIAEKKEDLIYSMFE